MDGEQIDGAPLTYVDQGISRGMALGLALVIGLPILAFLAIMILPGRMHLSECEDAIKAQLKAPSTYERVDYQQAGPLLMIQYDAQNSFGVPLRGSGVCNTSGSTVEWRDAGR